MAFCAIYIVAGLDARFGWSVMPLVTLIPGLLLYTISAVLGGWALIVNKHFEATARIQKDREHTVITSGPYKLVRHPGYLSALLGVAAVPLVLGSYVAFSCSIVVCFVMAIRTRLEDRMLRQELKGYSDYAEKVRYRLVPFIW